MNLAQDRLIERMIRSCNIITKNKQTYISGVGDGYTSCVKVGYGGNLDLSSDDLKKLFGLMFYTWWDGPLKMA